MSLLVLYTILFHFNYSRWMFVKFEENDIIYRNLSLILIGINPLTTAHFVTHRSYHTAGIVLRCAPRTANFWVGMHFCENIFQ